MMEVTTSLSTSELQDANTIISHNPPSTKIRTTPGHGTPISSIPPEIIFEIFIHCILYPIIIPNRHPPPISSAPWNLLLVCSKWRQLALETSTLWNDSSICWGRRYDDSTLQTLKLVLTRTGRSLISLEISLAYSLNQTALCEQIGHLIQPYADRFKRLSLDPADEFRRFLNGPCGMMDALQSISLSFSNDLQKYTLNDSDSYHPSIYPVTAFDNARNLCEVTILTQFATFHPQYFRLPWKQLTQLHLAGTPIPFIEGHKALCQCLNLVTATLTIPSDERCLQSSPITLLPHLSSLAICTATEHETACFGLFLRPFILPSLKEFELNTLSHSRDMWSQSDLLSLMKCSSCSLESFTAGWITPQMLHAFLRALPSLVEVSFPWIYLEPLPMLQMILEEIGNGSLVPNLRILECYIDILDDVLKMVEARTNRMDCRSPCTIINSVIIQAHTGDLGIIPRSVHELRARGIGIVFRYGGRDVDG